MFTLLVRKSGKKKEQQENNISSTFVGTIIDNLQSIVKRVSEINNAVKDETFLHFQSNRS